MYTYKRYIDLVEKNIHTLRYLHVPDRLFHHNFFCKILRGFLIKIDKTYNIFYSLYIQNREKINMQ